MSNVMVRLRNWIVSVWLEKFTAILGWRTIAMLTAALLISIASIIFNDNWILSIARQDALISQIKINIDILNTSRTHLYSAESSQRGYLLTQRSEYLALYKTALSEAKRNIRTIADLANKNLAHQPQDNEYKALIATTASLEAKADAMAMVLAFIENGKLDDAKQVMDSDQEILNMQSFMLNTQLLIDAQSKQLDALLAERNSTMMMARVSLIVGAIVLILLVVLVIKQLLIEISTKSNLQKLLVEHNKINDEKLAQQAATLNNLAFEYLSNVEQERHQLSRELHDEMGAILTATKMDVAWVMKKLKDDAPDIVDKLRKTNTYIDQGINIKRDIVERLHPSIIRTLGFWPALRLLIEDAAERNEWKLTLNFPEATPKVDDTVSLIAYRIVQESLNNSSKYAHASLVFIDIAVDGKTLKLVIKDNGVGFDVGVLESRSHGLAGMRHRVTSIGGRFEISSSPDSGTVTRIQLPITRMR